MPRRSPGTPRRDTDREGDGRAPSRAHGSGAPSSFRCWIVELDLEGRIADWDREAERVTGIPRASALGADFVSTVVAPDWRAEAARVLEHARRSEETIEAELSLASAAGQPIPCGWRWMRAGGGTRIVAVGQELARRRQLDALQVEQDRLLRMLATDADVRATLDELVRGIEQHSSGMLCSILRLDPVDETLHHAGSVSLPEAYCQAIDGTRIGPSTGSCGTAAYRRERVVVEDIELDPLWTDYRALAAAHGLRACWSQPVFSSGGKLLGTFAVYYVRPRGPTDLELELVERAAYLAGIALERAETQREQERMRARMLAAQKLESLGLLAGGIAHDFNNLLVGIVGNAELVRAQLPPDSPLAEDLQGILNAGWRAAELCRQLLAYAGRGMLAPQRIDLNRRVLEVARMLKANIPSKVELEFRLAEGLPALEMDPSQAQQVIMNLLTNAAEAIGDRAGTITLTTRAEPAAALPPGAPGARPANGWVVLEVRDTGCGMDAATVEQAFDPFFTTKPSGHGLGLAAVQGIVNGQGGSVQVTSEPEAGARFEVWFPSGTAAPDDAPDSAPASAPPADGGVVLIVDDEPAVRSVTRRILARLGYQVLEAAGGEVALALFAERAAEVRCVLLDLRMPGLSGDEVFEALRRVRPDVPVIISTGHGEEEPLQLFAGATRLGFVRKPFEMAELARALRERCEPTASGNA